jgi:hypothetical protein
VPNKYQDTVALDKQKKKTRIFQIELGGSEAAVFLAYTLHWCQVPFSAFGLKICITESNMRTSPFSSQTCSCDGIITG